MMYELPPQVQGTADQQLVAMRDYLVRLARELNRASNTEAAITEAVGKAASKAQQQTTQTVQQQAETLKALIIKNAAAITEQTDQRLDELHSTYVAISEYGNYYEQISALVEQTARETVESYHYTAAIEALEAYTQELNGQIRRGVMEDPSTHEMHVGIAISESLKFDGTWTDSETGEVYDKIEEGSTLGLYTSTGWQFWINGRKMGWFESDGSTLNVANITVENAINIGTDWTITTSGGFGLRYIGA